MKLPCFHVDAFASEAFAGNPAGVCLLEQWLSGDLLQKIAAENNLPETAFLVPKGSEFELRWFSPAAEIDLCGHATLASAFVLFEFRGQKGDAIAFHTRSGVLKVARSNDLFILDFPARPAVACDLPDGLSGGLGKNPLEILKARDYLAVFANEEEVLALKPDFARLAALDCLGVIVTAPGRDCDFVSRFFAPSIGVNEDPVTGSAHCTLIPYWSPRLGKAQLYARQRSARGGELFCEDRGGRVMIGGRAVLYATGEIHL